MPSLVSASHAPPTTTTTTTRITFYSILFLPFSPLSFFSFRAPTMAYLPDSENSTIFGHSGEKEQPQAMLRSSSVIRCQAAVMSPFFDPVRQQGSKLVVGKRCVACVPPGCPACLPGCCLMLSFSPPSQAVRGRPSSCAPSRSRTCTSSGLCCKRSAICWPRRSSWRRGKVKGCSGRTGYDG
jgi:hypothetical protein